jgi:hypothetical protein
LLLLRTFILRVRRGRQQSGIAFLQRTFGFISILVFASLGGFRISRGRISIDRSFLGKMRARNQKLVVLQKISRRTKVINNMQYKETIRKVNTFGLQDAYL